MNSNRTAESSGLRRMWQWLNAAPARSFAFRLALVTLGVYLAAFTHLLNAAGVDDWLERWQLEQMDYSVNTAPPKDLRLIYIDESDTLENVKGTFADEGTRQLWRAEHAKLLDALANAPLLVAFDLIFPPPDDQAEYKQADDKFGTAVRGARTRVLVGAELNEKNQPILSASVKGAEWGLTQIGGFRLEHGQSKELVRRYVLARSQLPDGSVSGWQPATPSLAVKMLLVKLSRSRSGPTSVTLDPAEKEVVLLVGSAELGRISCHIDLEAGPHPHLLATIPLHFPRKPAFDEENYKLVLQHLSRVATDYQDKIILIGAQISKEVAPTEGGEVVTLSPEPDERIAYGYQVHASVFSDLAQDTYPRWLGDFWKFVVLLVLGFVSGAGRAKLPKSDVEVDTKIFGTRNVPIGLLSLLGMYAVVVWVFYRSAFILFDAGYGALSVLLSYFLCGSVLMGRRKKLKKEAQ